MLERADTADCPFCAIGRSDVDAGLVAFRASNMFVVPALKQRVRRGSMLLKEKIAAMYPELVPVRRIGE